MQGDVLDRRRDLADQIQEHVALAVAELLALAARRSSPPRSPGARRAAAAGSPARSTFVLAAPTRPSSWRVALRAATTERPASASVGVAGLGLGPFAPAKHDRPVLRAARPERRSRRRPGAAPARSSPEANASPIRLHRTIDLDLLAAKLVHLSPEAVAHLVELARQPRHLVLPHDRHLVAEVPLADPPRRVQHRAHLPAEGPQQHRPRTPTPRRRTRPARPTTSGLDEKKPPDSLGPNRASRSSAGPGQVGDCRAELRAVDLDVAGVTARGKARLADVERPETGPPGCRGASRPVPSGDGPPRDRRTGWWSRRRASRARRGPAQVEPVGRHHARAPRSPPAGCRSRPASTRDRIRCARRGRPGGGGDLRGVAGLKRGAERGSRPSAFVGPPCARRHSSRYTVRALSSPAASLASALPFLDWVVTWVTSTATAIIGMTTISRKKRVRRPRKLNLGSTSLDRHSYGYPCLPGTPLPKHASYAGL